MPEASVPASLTGSSNPAWASSGSRERWAMATSGGRPLEAASASFV